MKKRATTLRDYLTRALETAEKAISDGEKGFIDADSIPSISRDLKRALELEAARQRLQKGGAKG